MFTQNNIKVINQLGKKVLNKKIKVKAFNKFGEHKVNDFIDDLSALAQHEIDHLNGILNIDRIVNSKVLFSIDEKYKKNFKKLHNIKKVIIYITDS